ncbi:MAG: hypothetical protein A2046_07990 [Bacteroidetes bacterium GWA2_30_7]|nr:MAG: hypothetical protein A2046_07990 [Bacteroidetes bacterium GWA2_30_7]
MAITEINAKSVLSKHKRIDSWFVARYSMNFYRGCMHNCAYCDGRADGYYVKGEFGKDITIKTNAIEILDKELNPEKKRKPLTPSFILLGGGVSDSYQPVEKKYEISRRALELILKYNYPVQILTKSTLVERDMDLLIEINKKSKVIVNFSFSSANDEISSYFEPLVPLPSERLETISKFKSNGISCGVFLMPVIPFITDSEVEIENTIKKVKQAGADFIIFSGMTLKEGTQKDYFFNILNKSYPWLIENYKKIYTGSEWGQASATYYQNLTTVFNKAISKYKLPQRIPANLFNKILYENDLITVMLEQIDYIQKSKGEPSPYGFAAYSINQLKEPVSNIKNNLQQLKGVGKFIEKIILEILETGTSKYYEKIINS